MWSVRIVAIFYSKIIKKPLEKKLKKPY